MRKCIFIFYLYIPSIPLPVYYLSISSYLPFFSLLYSNIHEKTTGIQGPRRSETNSISACEMVFASGQTRLCTILVVVKVLPKFSITAKFEFKIDFQYHVMGCEQFTYPRSVMWYEGLLLLLLILCVLLSCCFCLMLSSL